MIMKFKYGDLVRVKSNTHAEQMPEHRTGIIVEHKNGDHSHTKFYNVLFVGSDVVMRFHEMFLELLNEDR